MSYGRCFRERLLSRLIISPSGCLLWTGSRGGKGYGQIHDPSTKRPVYVHRVMYEMFVGPIPDGLQIDHLCRVKLCAAPSHLEAVTCRANLLRGTSPTAVNAVKTQCDHGHEFDLVNTRVKGNGRRDCRACAQQREAARVRTPPDPAQRRASQAVLRARASAGDPAVPHGTHAGYSNWGCRCLVCTEAHRERVGLFRAKPKLLSGRPLTPTDAERLAHAGLRPGYGYHDQTGSFAAICEEDAAHG